MEKIFTPVFLVIGMIASSQAQLISNSQLIRSNSPEVYNEIKTFCSEKWEGDRETLDYTINGQSDAFMELKTIMKKPDYDKKILGNALIKWGKIVKAIKCTDYEMLVNVYKNQIKAKEFF